jgi:hypothetical protein
MIEQTKKFEASYLKSLNEKLDAPLKSFNKKSIDDDFVQIEELLRDPNLLLESIQGLSVAHIKAKGLYSGLSILSEKKNKFSRLTNKPVKLFNRSTFPKSKLLWFTRYVCLLGSRHVQKSHFYW